jgi:tetratricopeptide (TPR) repeat protein
MVMTSGLAVFAFDKRDEARDQRREAEGLVGFMLGDLRQKLEPIGRLDALDAVGSRALEYFEKQDKSELSDEALAQRSKALTLMGEIAQTRGDLDGALRRYREAMAGTGEAVRRDPENGQKVFDHAQNVFWVGAVAYQRGLNKQAETAWREYKALASRLMAIDPDRKEWRAEPAYADTNLGTVLLQEKRYREASAVLRSALNASEALLASDPRNAAYQNQLMEALAWLSQARESEGQLNDALALRERQLDLFNREAARRGADTELKLKLLATHRAIGRLFAQQRDLREGFEHLRTSASIADGLLQTEPDNTEWAQRAAEVYFELGELELATGSIDQAGSRIRAGCAIADGLVAKDKSVADWRLKLQGSCLEHRTRLALTRSSLEEARALADQAIVLTAKELAQTQSIDSRFALAEARLLRGEVAETMADHRAAVRYYQAASVVWPRGVELKANQLSTQLIILEGLGRTADAKVIASRLQAMGYRHPAFDFERRMVRGSGRRL